MGILVLPLYWVEWILQGLICTVSGHMVQQTNYHMLQWVNKL